MNPFIAFVFLFTVWCLGLSTPGMSSVSMKEHYHCVFPCLTHSFETPDTRLVVLDASSLEALERRRMHFSVALLYQRGEQRNNLHGAEEHNKIKVNGTKPWRRTEPSIVDFHNPAAERSPMLRPSHTSNTYFPANDALLPIQGIVTHRPAATSAYILL